MSDRQELQNEQSHEESQDESRSEEDVDIRRLDLDNAVRDLMYTFNQKAERRREVISRLEKASELCQKFLNEPYCINCFATQLTRDGFKNFLFCIKEHFPEDVCQKLRLMETAGGNVIVQFH